MSLVKIVHVRRAQQELVTTKIEKAFFSGTTHAAVTGKVQNDLKT
jgi:hypothetical protein